MEENKMLEKLWSEAQSVEVPPDLEPAFRMASPEGPMKVMPFSAAGRRRRFPPETPGSGAGSYRRPSCSGSYPAGPTG